MQRDAAREAFASGRYALADVFLVSDVDLATLRARREADPSRTRRNFERHVLLRDTLLRWYGAIDRLEPGRVVFGLPAGGIAPVRSLRTTFSHAFAPALTCSTSILSSISPAVFSFSLWQVTQ